MQDLVNQLFASLRVKRIKIAVAESCTGGMLACALTHKGGASDVFERGFITYSNQAKIEMLGVEPNIIAKFGAVSTETAHDMAQGALYKSHAMMSLAITGIAGPQGGCPEKPVGTVYIGVALKSGASAVNVKTFKHHFEGNREEVRMASASMALKHALSILEDNDE